MGDPKESTNVAGRNTIGQDLSLNNNSDWKIEKIANNQSNYSSDQE